MWLYLIAAILIFVGLIGAAVGGGVFTIVLIPIGVVVLVSAVGYAMWGRAAQGSAGMSTEARPETGEPLPHTAARDTGRAPTSPEALADARRVEQ